MDFSKEIQQFRDTNLTSKDGKVIVPAVVRLFNDFQIRLTEFITDAFSNLRKDFENICEENNTKIQKLEEEVSKLRFQISKLDDKLDDNDAYERRDTLVISGSSVPTSTKMENCAQVACDLAKTSPRRHNYT